MRRSLRRLTWFLAATAAIPFAVGVVLYSRGMLPILPFWWQRPITEPSSEEYAAYSGFVDDFFSSNQPFRSDQSISTDNIVFIAAETLTTRNASDPILPLQVAALGSEDTGQDFLRQNARSWRLEPRFRTHLKCEVVDKEMAHRAASSGAEELFASPEKGDAGKWLPHASPAGPFPGNPRVSGGAAIVTSRLRPRASGRHSLLQLPVRRALWSIWLGNGAQDTRRMEAG
jgi:hypothetical protein